jgi:thymidine kinase
MITLILGPMFSGKSTELLRRLYRSYLAKKEVVLLRPSIDTRDFLTHNNMMCDWLQQITATGLGNLRCFDYDVIGIDEAQFHDGLVDFCLRHTKDKQSQIICSGLQASSEGEMFQPIQEIIPYCNDIIKLNAVCVKCGSDAASMTYYKKGGKKNRVKVGDSAEYEARCLDCWRSK